MNDLRKQITLFSGTVLFLNIVIGAGLLTLPGLVYEQVGEQSVFSWLFAGLVSLPLLIVFIFLGKNHPDAGGIAHYALRAFGSVGQRIAALLFFGAVLFGLPSIALTGAYYMNIILPYNVHIYAITLIVLPASLHLFSSNAISRSLKIVGSSVILVLFTLLFVSLNGVLANSEQNTFPTLLSAFEFKQAVAPFMMIFFAFTGWEIGSHSAEEFVNPKRDYPLAMILSYIITMALYIAIAWILQLAKLESNFETPFVGITERVIGEYGRYFVSAVAVSLVFANLFGAVWGVSRLVYSLSRDRIIPEFVGKTYKGTPILSVLIVVTALLCVVGLSSLGIIELEYMLALAGQNFLILYGIAALCLFVLSNKKWVKALSVIVVLLVATLIYFTSINILYPLCLTITGILLSLYQK